MSSCCSEVEKKSPQDVLCCLIQDLDNMKTDYDEKTEKASRKDKSEKTSEVHKMVSDYYGERIAKTSDLRTSACTSAPPSASIRKLIGSVPKEILQKYYGCGSPLPQGIAGLTVVDLGCGSGRDCYILSKLVGEHGKVIGIDMLEGQLSVAKKFISEYTEQLGYKATNMTFKQGFIERVSEYVEKGSVDVVTSNCVVNLSPRKDLVLSGVWEVLREGGEFYFSDVYCDRRLSSEIRGHSVLVGECLGGALYVEDFRRLCQKTGFADPRVFDITEIAVTDDELKRLLGNARFWSITYRLFKLDGLEDKCEDYGQLAVYKGSIPESASGYWLDQNHWFETGKPTLVCGNTAIMLSKTWLNTHFHVYGSRAVHYGLFDCGEQSAGGRGKKGEEKKPAKQSAVVGGAKGCCGGGSCC